MLVEREAMQERRKKRERKKHTYHQGLCSLPAAAQAQGPARTRDQENLGEASQTSLHIAKVENSGWGETASLILGEAGGEISRTRVSSTIPK